MAGKSPRRPRPDAAPPQQDEGMEQFDVQEVLQDLSQQLTDKTVELAAAKAVIRKLRKDLLEKSKNAPPQE